MCMMTFLWCVKAIRTYDDMNYIVFDQALNLWPTKLYTKFNG